MSRVLYLHGFASGPTSKKGTAISRALRARGVSVVLADLNVPSFAKLSPVAALAHIDALARESAPSIVFGSSMGGYLAALYAAQHPELVSRLFLLCPAFDLAQRWTERYGAEGIARWKREGSIVVPDGAGVSTPLHFAFFEESVSLPPFPDAVVETHIVHGTRDDVVPIEASRTWMARAPELVSLTEVDDDHELLASLALLEEEAVRFVVRAS